MLPSELRPSRTKRVVKLDRGVLALLIDLVKSRITADGFEEGEVWACERALRALRKAKKPAREGPSLRERVQALEQQIEALRGQEAARE